MEATTFADIRGATAPRAARTATLDLIWADKVGLYMAALGLVFIAYIWSMAAMAAGVSGANHIMQHEICDALACDLAIAASFWLFFRAADWAFGGPRRRAKQRAR